MASLPRSDGRKGSKVSMAHCMGTKIRQNCQVNSQVRQGQWLGSADGQRCRLGSLLGCSCKQEYDLLVAVSLSPLLPH